MRNLRRIFHAVFLMVMSSWVWGALVHAGEEVATKGEVTVGKGLIALGAGLAIGMAAFGTGIAQSRIGSAGAGVIAEKPELAGLMIVFLAIPETIVILGFVISAIALFMF